MRQTINNSDRYFIQSRAFGPGADGGIEGTPGALIGPFANFASAAAATRNDRSIEALGFRKVGELPGKGATLYSNPRTGTQVRIGVVLEQAGV